MFFICSIAQNPDTALESSLLKKALPNSGMQKALESFTKEVLETYQQSDKNEILQKLEQLDQKIEGDSVKYNKNNSNREGELATSTSLGLRRRPLVKQSYVPENIRNKRTSNKRPLPKESLEENTSKGKLINFVPLINFFV